MLYLDSKKNQLSIFKKGKGKSLKD